MRHQPFKVRRGWWPWPGDGSGGASCGVRMIRRHTLRVQTQGGRRLDQVLDPSFVDPRLDSRSITFENARGARGAGGQAHGGRKGAPNRRIAPGERVVLADVEGPGTIR